MTEERFEQRASNAGSPPKVQVTRADFLLVRAPDRADWIPFRDVYEVNGREVRDHAVRLQKLLVETPATALEKAAAITAESSRYNIGTIVRTINLPTFPLMLLRADYRQRFEFRQRGVEVVNGRKVLRIAFLERSRPTIAKSIRGVDVPLDGSFWLDPDSSSVVKALVKTVETPEPGQADHFSKVASGQTRMWVQVFYAYDERIGAAVPVDLRELGVAPDGAWVEGKASYTNYRRFQVNTTEVFRSPKER